MSSTSPSVVSFEAFFTTLHQMMTSTIVPLSTNKRRIPLVNLGWFVSKRRTDGFQTCRRAPSSASCTYSVRFDDFLNATGQTDNSPAGKGLFDFGPHEKLGKNTRLEGTLSSDMKWVNVLKCLLPHEMQSKMQRSDLKLLRGHSNRAVHFLLLPKQSRISRAGKGRSVIFDLEIKAHFCFGKLFSDKGSLRVTFTAVAFLLKLIWIRIKI